MHLGVREVKVPLKTAVPVIIRLARTPTQYLDVKAGVGTAWEAS